MTSDLDATDTMTDSPISPRAGLIAIGSFDHDRLSKSLADIPASVRPLIAGLFVPVVEPPVGGPGRPGYATTADAKQLLHIAEDSGIPVTTVTLERDGAGYGAVQKVAFGWAMQNKLDVVVVVHASGHFPLGHLDQMIRPVLDGDAGGVLARRSTPRRGPRSERISWWKLKGNRCLSMILDRIVGKTSNEWLCPFRSYSTRVLAAIPFRNNSDGHVFDLEMLVGCAEIDETLVEIEVPVISDDG